MSKLIKVSYVVLWKHIGVPRRMWLPRWRVRRRHDMAGFVSSAFDGVLVVIGGALARFSAVFDGRWGLRAHCI